MATAVEALESDASRVRVRIWAAYAALGALLAGYLFLLIFRPAAQQSQVLNGWLVDCFELAASGLCIYRGLSTTPRRVVPIILGLGLLSWAFGDLAVTFQTANVNAAPTVSVADGFYLLFYPVTYIGVVLSMRGELRRLTTPSWLDGAVAGLGAASLCAAFAFRSIEHSAGGTRLDVTVNLAYPVGDVLLLILVFGGTMLLAGRRRAAWMMMAAGLSLNVVGDTFNLFGQNAATSHLGDIFNALAWPTATFLISLSVWLRPRTSDPMASLRPTGFLLPGTAAVAALTILALSDVTHPGAVAIGLAAATLVIVGIRLGLSLRGLRTLTEERLRQSITDELTGLGNRRYLAQILDAYFAEQGDSRVAPRKLAFLFIDLDHFKEINDSFGHPAGDELLRRLGPRMEASLRPNDALVRLGGDEFAAVLVDTDADQALVVAERLAEVVAEPFDLGTVQPRIGASIGVAIAPHDANDATELLWCADAAMYRAKSGRTSVALFRRELDDSDRWDLVQELRAALEDGGLALHYQPQLDLKTGEVTAVEALVRWPHPRHGLMPPADFLPLAEEAGLMSELTTWVLLEALGQCAAWRAEGRRMAMAVNVSAPTLLAPGLVDMVKRTLERCGVPAEFLIIEITETSVVTDFDRSRAVISELRALGLTVSIDDFGAGFTSLAYLSSLPVRELKLDRAFITGLARADDRDLQLVRATVELGHALGLRVVAEGVEDAATYRLLSQLGCDCAQGYFICRPKPAADLAFRSTASPIAADALSN